jgi:hypothetical protein
MNEKVDLWHKHVATVEREFKNAVATPSWWDRMWASIIAAFNEPLYSPAPTVKPADPPQPHITDCPHTDMRETTLGALIKEPKAGDMPLLGIEARECPKCKMVTAVLR